MASKRTANSDLNADNWNDEDEPEDPGTFQKAPEDVLSKRVVKTAKRRLPPTGGDEAAKSAFSSFSGFKATPTYTPSSSLFSFLVKTSAESSTTSTVSSTFGTNKSFTSNGATKISENGLGASATTASSSLISKDSKPESTTKESSSKKPPKYCAKLKGLNQSVAKWIQQHVDANPICILTPIFRDYEKYLKQIENELDDDTLKQKSDELKHETKSEIKTAECKSEKKSEPFTFGSSKPTTNESNTDSWKTEKSIFGGSSNSAKSIFSSNDKSDNKSPFNIPSSEKSIFSKTSTTSEAKKDEEVKKDDKSSFSSPFSQTNSLSTPVSPPSATFSFGQSTVSSTVSAGFSFGGGKPFSFGAGAVNAAEPEEKKDENEDEDEEPPKPEFKPVVEEGSIYEQKCKVFVKKDGNYCDRGVGTLFLKPTPNDKMQLIVRATNSLGNLLLNTLLSENIPIKRLNKTNIMLVCLPMPTAEPPPVATLLRVKTAEEADALFEALEKHKK